MITQLYEQAAEKKMDYRPFSFPLELNSEKTKLVFTHKSVKTELDLSPDGFTYLAYRIGEFINRSKAKALYRAGEYEKFVQYVNQCRKQQEEKDLWRKGKELIIAFNGGKLWGVLTHYNPKSNLEVLRDISDAALEQHISFWTLSEKEMNVYLKYASVEGYEIGLNVRNGETGHATYSYRFYVRKGEYTFSTDTFGKRRHLSNLELVDNTLKDAYAELSEIKFHDFVMTTASLEFAKLILADQELEKLFEGIKPYVTQLKKVYQLLSFLSQKSEERGFKTASKKALDLVYTKIIKEM